MMWHGDPDELVKVCAVEEWLTSMLSIKPSTGTDGLTPYQRTWLGEYLAKTIEHRRDVERRTSNVVSPEMRITILEAALRAYMEPAGDTPQELRRQAQKALGIKTLGSDKESINQEIAQREAMLEHLQAQVNTMPTPADHVPSIDEIIRRGKGR
jgi:hypothetical protein